MQSTTSSQPESCLSSMQWDASTSIEGVVPLDQQCLDELLKVADELVRHPLAAPLLNYRDFDLSTCRDLCRQVRQTLDDGVGFAIIESLPVDQVGDEIATKLYWLLMSMIGRPVAQKWNGEMIYDVTDTGKRATAGSGVRSSKTNGGQVYHTDNSFNVPPAYVGLMCLRPALQGGESGLISFDSVYQRLAERHSEVIPRLFEPMYFDRQREHAADDALVSHEPVFDQSTGALHVRLATNIIRHGYTVADKAMDDGAQAALAALDEVMEAEDLGRTFDFQSGQIQVVNNRRIGHRRTAFVDSPDPAFKRHLIRIWLRDEGRIFYQG